MMDDRRNGLYNMLEYVPIIVTLIAAAYVSILAARSSIAADEIGGLILLLITLLATSQLLDRFRLMKRIDSNIKELLEAPQGLSSLSSATTFFSDKVPNLEKRLNQANSVDINGITLSRTSENLWKIFERNLRNGAKIRFLIIDPYHDVLKIEVNCFHKHQNPDKLLRDMEHTLDNFDSLTQELDQEVSEEQFQVRLLPFVPPYGIWIIDKGLPNSEIWVELYPFRDVLEPAFHLIPHTDKKWFSFFEEQFEKMWNFSRRYSGERYRWKLEEGKHYALLNDEWVEMAGSWKPGEPIK